VRSPPTKTSGRRWNLSRIENDPQHALQAVNRGVVGARFDSRGTTFLFLHRFGAVAVRRRHFSAGVR
jgi:hypothetical protein